MYFSMSLQEWYWDFMFNWAEVRVLMDIEDAFSTLFPQSQLLIYGPHSMFRLWLFQTLGVR